MKKLLLLFLITFFMSQSVLAATIVSERNTKLDKKENKILFPIKITANTDNEITSEYGIDIILPVNKKILWNKTDSYFISGTAVDNNKISSTATPHYSKDYKVLHLNILENLMKDEYFIISKLSLRAYNKRFIDKLLLNVDSDISTYEAIDVNTYEVTDSIVTDNTKPYPPTDLKAEFNMEKNEVNITWNNPPDYDLVTNIISKTYTNKSSTTTDKLLSNMMILTNYTDTKVELGDNISYKICAKDTRNLGCSEVSITIPTQEELDTEKALENKNTDIKESETTIDVSKEELDTEKNTDIKESVSEEEISYLKRMYNYFKLRNQIKCNPKYSEYVCYTSKIPLVYAETILNRFESNISLSNRELNLMSKRIKYAKNRYESNCVNTNKPKKTCFASKNHIKFTEYLLEKNGY